MPEDQETTKKNVLHVVTNIRIVQGKLKAEYAEVNFTGEIESKRLSDKYFSIHQDAPGRFRFR